MGALRSDGRVSQADLEATLRPLALEERRACAEMISTTAQQIADGSRTWEESGDWERVNRAIDTAHAYAALAGRVRSWSGGGEERGACDT